MDREERRDRDWRRLRSLIGAGPHQPVFPTRRQHLSELKSGEKFLLIRKLGGLGDILMTSALFPDLFEQHPEIEVTYAVPMSYLSLFDGHGTKLKMIEHQQVYGPVNGHHGPESPHHAYGIQKWTLEEFDLIEDISYPCHTWERLQIKHRSIVGETGLRWRNRMDRWARWIGLNLKNPRTILKLTEEEIDEAHKWFGQASLKPGSHEKRSPSMKNDHPRLLWAPLAAMPNRSYPWFRELKAKLETEGYDVWYLHHEDLGEKTLHGLSFRQMGAAVQAADFVLSVDSSAFHWAGLLGKPVIGLFNLLLGESHAQYYATAHTLQLCSTPCIAARYVPGPCDKWYQGSTPLSHGGQKLSACFHPDSLEQTLDAVKEKFPRR